jgi:hypothetical protein
MVEVWKLLSDDRRNLSKKQGWQERGAESTKGIKNI